MKFLNFLALFSFPLLTFFHSVLSLLMRRTKVTQRKVDNNMAEAKLEKVSQSVFDLDSKQDVTLFKAGEFTPVENMQEFVSRLANDQKEILSIVNEGLRSHFRDQLKADSSVPWMQENEEGELEAFSGTPISEEASKKLQVSVLGMAKVLGYEKSLSREQKKALKEQAQEMILSNPVAVEKLRAQ